MTRKFLDGLYLAAGIAAAGFLLVIFLLMMGLAVGREANFNIPAADDFAAWSMAAMAFLGLAHTFRAGDIIRVGVLVERLNGRARWFFELLALAVAMIFTLYFARHAVQLTYDSWRFNDMAQGVVAVPLWIPQLGYSGGLVIFGIALIDEFVHVARGHSPRYLKEKPKSPEELVERVAQGGGV
jgi:TRAP-type C4-dicarboxylate transport system permease small subunit